MKGDITVAELELMPNEAVVRETLAQHVRKKWHVVVRTLTLTNQRLMLRISGHDPISDNLSLRGLFAMLLGKSPSKGKPILELPLVGLAAMTRTKFGFNDRVLQFQTAGGEEHKIIVDDCEGWIEAISAAVNSTGCARMVAAAPNRWVVERTRARSS